MDMRSDILPDLQPGYPAGFQLCPADPTPAADSSGLPPCSERKGGVASVCLYPSHHCRDSCSSQGRSRPGPAAPSRGGRGPALRRRPGAVEARPCGAVPGRSRPGLAAPSNGGRGPTRRRRAGLRLSLGLNMKISRIISRRCSSFCNLLLCSSL